MIMLSLRRYRVQYNYYILTIFNVCKTRKRTHTLHRTAVFMDANKLWLSVWDFLLEYDVSVYQSRCGATSRNICFYFRVYGRIPTQPRHAIVCYSSSHPFLMSIVATAAWCECATRTRTGRPTTSYHSTCEPTMLKYFNTLRVWASFFNKFFFNVSREACTWLAESKIKMVEYSVMLYITTTLYIIL